MNVIGKCLKSELHISATTKWVAISAAIGGMFVISGQIGRARCATHIRPTSIGRQVRVRTQNGSENGAPSPVISQLEITLRHSLRFPPPFHLQSPFHF